MKIIVNGEDQDIDRDAVSVNEILKVCEVSQPDMVSVQLNGEFVNKDAYESTNISEGDEIDFLYFMGGGQ